YGNPIPGLDKLGVGGAPAPPAEPGLVRLDGVARSGGGTVQIRRLGEHVQLNEWRMVGLRRIGPVRGGTRADSQSTDGKKAAMRGDGAGRTLERTALHSVLATVTAN